MKQKLWRILVRAAPTCTLYRHHFNMDVLEFRFWPRYRITMLEVVDAG
jgi:hypothetical protein